MPPQETTFGGKFFDEMRLLLEETFRLDELKILCMELDVIPDNVPGDTLRAKIHGLLDEFRRIGRLPELVEYCRQARPHKRWPDPSVEDLALLAEKIDLLALRNAMTSAFNVEDLKVLCFEIEALLQADNVPDEVNLEVVGGSGKAAIIVNLIDHLKRRQQIPYLVKAVRSNRPRII